ncbi:hypothetical protein D3C81_2009830 [compost metagenome]
MSSIIFVMAASLSARNAAPSGPAGGAATAGSARAANSGRTNRRVDLGDRGRLGTGLLAKGGGLTRGHMPGKRRAPGGYSMAGCGKFIPG